MDDAFNAALLLGSDGDHESSIANRDDLFLQLR